MFELEVDEIKEENEDESSVNKDEWIFICRNCL